MASEQLRMRDPNRIGEWDDIERGEFAYGTGPLANVPDGQAYFIFWRSADATPVCIPVDRGPKRDGAWQLSGPDDCPTISPSVWVSPPDGWHGWIRDGKAEDA